MQVPGLFSRRLTWALNNTYDIQHAFLTQLDANALRRARPKFFDLAHEATHSGIRNRLELFDFNRSVTGQGMVAYHDVDKIGGR